MVVLPRSPRAWWLVPVALTASAPAHAGAIQVVGAGVRTGVSVAHFHGSSSDFLGPDYRFGFGTSFYTRIRLTDRISLRPELGWIEKGGDSDVRISVSSPGQPPFVFDARSESRLDYIELPILAQMDLPLTGPAQPYLIGGPMVAWNAREDRETQLVIRDAPTTSLQYARIFEDAGTFDGDLGVRSFDAGAVAGLGVRTTRGRTRFGLEGRYTHGFLNVLAGRGEAELRNAAFAITAILEF